MTTETKLEEAPTAEPERKQSIKAAHEARKSVGTWTPPSVLTEKYGYGKNFWSAKFHEGRIRRKADGKGFLYASKDAAQVVSETRKRPYGLEYKTRPGKQLSLAAAVKKAKAQTESSEEVSETVPQVPSTPKAEDPSAQAKVRRVTFYVLGVELEEFTKDEAFDEIARIIHGAT
jgi:hypothetical protein